jgi:DNA polymerase type B, organellar and viral
MFNAMKYGYKFNILRGYLFDQEYIFKYYITDLYEIKKSQN